jgi:hypothetical protein
MMLVESDAIDVDPRAEIDNHEVFAIGRAHGAAPSGTQPMCRRGTQALEVEVSNRTIPV